MNISQPQFVEGTDYYREDGLYVFTAAYLLKRGYCCQAGCRHCPYPPPGDSESRPKTCSI